MASQKSKNRRSGGSGASKKGTPPIEEQLTLASSMVTIKKEEPPQVQEPVSAPEPEQYQELVQEPYFEEPSYKEPIQEHVSVPTKPEPVPEPIYQQPTPIQHFTSMTQPSSAKSQPRMPELDRIGGILKRVRDSRGESLEDIASYLCIRTTYLRALEDNRYEDLPADAYVIGFLRTYANYLGLDGRGAIDQYRREMAGRRKKPLLSMPQPMTEGQTPSATVLIGAVIAVLIIYLAWYSLSGSDHTADTSAVLPPVTTSAPLSEDHSNSNSVTNGTIATVAGAPVPTELSALPPPPAQPAQVAPAQVAPAPVAQNIEPAAVSATAQQQAQTQVAAPLAQPPVAPSPKADTIKPTEVSISAKAEQPETTDKDIADKTNSDRIIIKADKESWILIVDARGSTIFDHVLKPGETYKIPDQKGLRLTTGNATGITLTQNSTKLDLFEKGAHVVRNIPLDSDKIKKQ